ncbi:hypothetical protein BH09ACT13_BH09ACT13_05000 [soil metagenome]
MPSSSASSPQKRRPDSCSRQITCLSLSGSRTRVRPSVLPPPTLLPPAYTTQGPWSSRLTGMPVQTYTTSSPARFLSRVTSTGARPLTTPMPQRAGRPAGTRAVQHASRLPGREVLPRPRRGPLPGRVSLLQSDLHVSRSALPCKCRHSTVPCPFSVTHPCTRASRPGSCGLVLRLMTVSASRDPGTCARAGRLCSTGLVVPRPSASYGGSPAQLSRPRLARLAVTVATSRSPGVPSVR